MTPKNSGLGGRQTSHILEQLTLEEKATLLEGSESWYTAPVERLGIRALTLTDGPHGVRKIRARDGGSGGFDIGENEPATSFPTASAVAASWAPENARLIGRAIARECRHLGVDALLAPGINIMRDPRCGRNFEYFSEDPLITGVFGSAFITGVQGEGVAACVKHFAANSNENFRFVGDSVVDERALREIYLRAFERVIKTTQPATVMCAYNKLNGTYCSDNRELLTDILRSEWGFDGLVMTDWGATHDRVAGIKAGVDLDMPGGVPHNRAAIMGAVRDRTLETEAVDEAVDNVLQLVGHAAMDPLPPGDDLGEHDALATEVALDSAVLLHNQGLLPLSGHERIAVVGEFFERLRFQGAGSSLVTPRSVTTAKNAFDQRGVQYVYARGFRSLETRPDSELADEAVRAARGADAVLFFGGLGDLEESEGFDRDHLRLSEAQTALLSTLADTGVPVVLILHAGSAVEIPEVERLAAVLHMHLPGMHGGEATAALLLGERSPSGKLAQSWPRHVSEISDVHDYNAGPIAKYYESIYVGYRFYDKAGTPVQFPFGHGLSYSTFEYHDLQVSEREGEVKATVTVHNTGTRDASEVVQLYVGNNESAVFKATRELRAFTKVHVPAGGSVRASMHFTLADLSYWDVRERDWILENGTYLVQVAASSADIRLEAPIRVVSGQATRSPYPKNVDRAYATPPHAIPSEFSTLVGRPIPQGVKSRRLTMETRLADARGSLLGAILYAAIVGHVRRDYRHALRLPDSLERDARVKNAYFLVRMMPTSSMRSLAMSSNGRFPYYLADGLADIAAWHPVKGLRKILAGRRQR